MQKKSTTDYLSTIKRPSLFHDQTHRYVPAYPCFDHVSDDTTGRALAHASWNIFE